MVEELLVHLRASLEAFQETPADSEFLRGYEYAHRLWLDMIEEARCANVLIEDRLAEVKETCGPAFYSGFECGIEDVHEDING